jgi:hypothetical protein
MEGELNVNVGNGAVLLTQENEVLFEKPVRGTLPDTVFSEYVRYHLLVLYHNCSILIFIKLYSLIC